MAETGLSRLPPWRFARGTHLQGCIIVLVRTYVKIRCSVDAHSVREDALKSHFIVPVLVFAVLVAAVIPCRGQAPAATPGKDASDIVLLLEKSGYKYTKVSDGVWEITFAGKNTGDFRVRLALAGNIVLAIAKLADRKDVKTDPVFLTKLLECNDQFDFIKIALSKDMLYLRMEATTRLLDGQELKHVLEQVSAATDEIYPQIKQFLPQSQGKQ